MVYQWSKQASCKDLPKHLFYDYELSQPARIPEKVKSACEVCPVLESCLEHALKFENFGYWALTTPGDRRRIRRRDGLRVVPVFDLLSEGLEGLLIDLSA